MKKKMSIYLVLMVMVFALFGCSQKPQEVIPKEKPVEKVEIMVSAAASLTDALTEMKSLYEKKHSNVQLTFNLGSSGKLAQQIEQGAPVDIFLSADQKSMDELEKKSMLLSATRVDFTGNELVLISNKDNKIGITSINDIDAKNINHIAIGEPESVPAGKYAKEVLDKVGKWESVQAKLVLAKDVRQVLTYVESGNADLGFVYASDARMSNKIAVLANADSSMHTPIIYPAGVIKDSKHLEEAKQFIDFLQSKTGQSILEKYGFGK